MTAVIVLTSCENRAIVGWNTTVRTEQTRTELPQEVANPTRSLSRYGTCAIIPGHYRASRPSGAFFTDQDMRLEIDSRLVGDVLVVRCRGRIVAGAEAELFHNHLNTATQGTPAVVLELAETQFVDSSGIGTLVRQMTHARSRGGDLKLCRVPEFLTKTLRMASLNTIFESYPSDADAIEAFYKSRPSKNSEVSYASPTILCLDPSGDVLAFLRELLRQAGYRVLTTRMWPDAKILLKAARPDLLIIGGKPRVSGEITPNIPTFLLDEQFSTGDPGSMGLTLLEKIAPLLSRSDKSGADSMG